MTVLSVIAIASSAPGGDVAPSGASGAQALTGRVAGAERSGAERSSVVPGGLWELGLTNKEKASAPDQRAKENDADALENPANRVSAPDITATATPWLGALRLAPLARVSASPVAGDPGRRTATRTLRSSYRSRAVRHNCAGVSERGTTEGGVSLAQRRGDIGWSQVAEAPEAETNSGFMAGGRIVVGSPPRSETCRARKALAFYRASYRGWRERMGAGGSTTAGGSFQRPSDPRAACPRYLARVYRQKARNARKAYERWHAYHYDWRSWLPAKHQRVAACETGHQGGTGPGGSRWDWDSGTYVSAFGIYRPAYDDDAHRIGNLGWDETKRKLGRFPTPREQMQAVDSHRAAHGGWSGWGCRGA